MTEGSNVELNKYEERVKTSFQHELEKHGYGFQYAILKAISDSFPERSAFMPEVVEFPIYSNNKDSRIDFVLRRSPNPNSGYNPLILVAECKRPNPAFSNWCFFKSPTIPKQTRREFVNVQEFWKVGNRNSGLFMDSVIQRIPGGLDESQEEIVPSSIQISDSTIDAYDLSFTLRTNQKGESSSFGKDAIEESVTQVLRGLNGLYQFAIGSQKWMKNCLSEGRFFLRTPKVEFILCFMPVIFTTAQLWVSDIDLSFADIESGRITLPDQNFKKAHWLLYQYNQSQSLKHPFVEKDNSEDLSSIIEKQFRRTIAIVHPTGLNEFLSWGSALRINEPRHMRG